MSFLLHWLGSLEKVCWDKDRILMRNNASFDSAFEGLVGTTPEKLFLNFNLNAIEKEDDERSKLAKDIGLKPPIQIICSSMVTSAAFHQGIFKTARLKVSERVLKL